MQRVSYELNLERPCLNLLINNFVFYQVLTLLKKLHTRYQSKKEKNKAALKEDKAKKLDASGKERKLNHFERKNFVNYEPTPMSDDEDSVKGGKDNKQKDTGVVKTIKDGNIIETAAPIA